MQGLSPAHTTYLPIPAPELHTLRDNAKHKNAAGGLPPAAQRGDLVLQILCPYFIEPHAAAGIIVVFAQRFQPLVAVLRSHLAGFGIVNEFDHSRNVSSIVSAQPTDGNCIGHDRPSYIALLLF